MQLLRKLFISTSYGAVTVRWYRRPLNKPCIHMNFSQFQIMSDGGNRNALLDVSNRFYTLIPHDFGMKKPPMLDNMDMINVG